MQGARVFGVIRGTPAEPRVAYLREALPVTEKLLELAQPAEPPEVFRFAAPCAGKACQHFDGVNCALVTKLTPSLPKVIDGIPPCSLRPDCRWWQQEKAAACARCPQVVTEMYHPTEALRTAADPKSPA
jgi:hypothetical protein